MDFTKPVARVGATGHHGHATLCAVSVELISADEGAA